MYSADPVDLNQDRLIGQYTYEVQTMNAAPIRF